MELCVPLSLSGINSPGKGAADEAPPYPSYQANASYMVGIRELWWNGCTNEKLSPEVVFWPRWVDSQQLLMTVFCVELVALTLVFIPAFTIKRKKNFTVFVFFLKVN